MVFVLASTIVLFSFLVCGRHSVRLFIVQITTTHSHTCFTQIYSGDPLGVSSIATEHAHAPEAAHASLTRLYTVEAMRDAGLSYPRLAHHASSRYETGR